MAECRWLEDFRDGHNFLKILRSFGCGSRKLDLRALGYGTTRFCDPAHPARAVAEGSGD
jgi:hypothetical protein